MKGLERTVLWYDLKTSALSKLKGLPSPSPESIARAFAGLFEGELAEVTNNKKQSRYIADLKDDGAVLELLIGFTDPLAADHTYRDPVAKKRRVLEKLDDEGDESSAHIVWAYGSHSPTGTTPFLLEQVPGLSSAAVAKFLNALLRLAKAAGYIFECPDPAGTRDKNGKFKNIPFRPRVELQGHPSKQFMDDLKKGQIQTVEFYTESDHNKPWDANGYAIEDRRILKIKPARSKTVPLAKAFLDALSGPKKDYEKARIIFKTDDGSPRRVDVYSDTYGFANDIQYIKRGIIVLKDKLPKGMSNIQALIARKMRRML